MEAKVQLESAKVTGEEYIGRGKFLALKCVSYNDAKGVQRKWEVVDRVTKQGNSVDAVDVIAIYKKDKEPDKVVIIKQFRPPPNKVVIEFPAGMVDEEHDGPAKTALRELKEETGYQGKVVTVSPELVYEPGMSGSNLNVVHLEIDGNVDVVVQSEQEEDEFIVTELVPVKELLSWLSSESKKGYTIDAKVWTFAFGVSFV